MKKLLSGLAGIEYLSHEAKSMAELKGETMKYAIALVISLASSAAIAAIPETTNLTCREAQSLVKRNGVINMTVNGGRYQRFVADDSWCFSDEYAALTWTPTADQDNCVLYTCKASH